MNRLLLGSTSPRRKEILRYFSIPFESAPPSFPEKSIPWKGDPRSYVIALAEGKARSLISSYPNHIILTADTIVHYKRKLYGKPKNETDAQQMLSELSGQWHSVFTGVTVYNHGHSHSELEETNVLLNKLTQRQIALYLRQLHCTDKAGGYLIQQSGGIIVSKIQGCYFNVMGLPINAVQKLLKNVNIDLWEHLK